MADPHPTPLATFAATRDLDAAVAELERAQRDLIATTHDLLAQVRAEGGGEAREVDRHPKRSRRR